MRERGAAPGTRSAGDLPSRLAQSCRPTPPLLLAGGCRSRPHSPCMLGGAGGLNRRTEGSGKLAQRQALSQHPQPLAPGHQGGRRGSPHCPEPRGLSGNHVSPRPRPSPSSSDSPYPRPLLCIGRRLGPEDEEGFRGAGTRVHLASKAHTQSPAWSGHGDPHPARPSGRPPPRHHGVEVRHRLL